MACSRVAGSPWDDRPRCVVCGKIGGRVMDQQEWNVRNAAGARGVTLKAPHGQCVHPKCFRKLHDYLQLMAARDALPVPKE